MGEDKIAAWIMCEDLLVKVKAELANEAIVTLQSEVKAGRMKVEGKMVSTIEVVDDTERDLFVANEIAAESHEMLQSYAEYIKQKEKSSNLTADEVILMENSKKLMLAVHEITLLMGYRTVTEEWILEIEGMPQIEDPVQLLTSTIHGREDERFDVLDFSLKRKSLQKEGSFTDDERKMMLEALQGVDPSYD